MSEKKGLKDKILGLFFDGTVDDAKKYIKEDVLKPGIRKAFHDTVIGGAESLISGRGNATSGGWSGNPSYKSGTNYDKVPFKGKQPDATKPVGGFQNVAFPTWERANEILIDMQEEIGRYGHTTVATLYEAAGAESDAQYNKWGWENLYGVTIKPVSNGFVIDLPKPHPLQLGRKL